MIVFTRLITLIVGLFTAFPVVALERPDPRNASMGISLGSDAYLAKMTDSGIESTDFSVLVPPGTPLLLFPGINKKSYTLALSNLGIWLYVPTDASNLVPQATLLVALKDHFLFNRRWIAFSQRTRVTGADCVTFTPGETVPISGSTDPLSVVVHLFSSNPVLTSKYNDVAEACSGLSEEVISLPVRPEDHHNIVDITSFFKDEIEYNDQINRAVLDRLRSGRSIDLVVSKISRELFFSLPKIIELGEILSYDCNTKSMAETVKTEDSTEETFSVKLGSALEFLKIETSASIKQINSLSREMNKVFETGFAVADIANVYIEKEIGRYFTFGKVATCKNFIEKSSYSAGSAPFFYRMHWENNTPFLVDVGHYHSAVDDGLTWNQSTGFIEISCFHIDYPKLQSKLSATMTSKQAQIFMLRYVRPTLGRWRDVYRCERPTLQQPEVAGNQANPES